jgi:hypothetical protein
MQAELELVSVPSGYPEDRVRECVEPDLSGMAAAVPPIRVHPVEGTPFTYNGDQLLVPRSEGDTEAVLRRFITTLHAMEAPVWRVTDIVGCELWTTVPTSNGFAILLYVSFNTFDWQEIEREMGPDAIVPLPAPLLARCGHIVTVDWERTFSPAGLEEPYATVLKLSHRLAWPIPERPRSKASYHDYAM